MSNFFKDLKEAKLRLAKSVEEYSAAVVNRSRMLRSDISRDISLYKVDVDLSRYTDDEIKAHLDMLIAKDRMETARNRVLKMETKIFTIKMGAQL
jgi:hypothetical protein